MVELKFKQFCHWILEREAVRMKRESGLPPPWTDDVVIGNYHFCNIRREDDRVTKEIREVVTRLVHNEKDLPWVYTAARMFNSAVSLETYLLEGAGRLKDTMAAGGVVFHTAYVVTTNGKKMNKIDYVEEVVDQVKILRIPRNSCRLAYCELQNIHGLGTFLAGQIVADLKNDRYLLGADDWNSFSVIGPGSKKGLSYLFGRSVGVSEYDRLIKAVDDALPPEIKALGLHRQDLQNCLCEFSKYIRYIDNLPGRRRPYHARYQHPQREQRVPEVVSDDARSADRIHAQWSSKGIPDPGFD